MTTTPPKRGPGRPRKPIEPPPESVTVEVRNRKGLHLKTHENVPGTWTVSDIIKRFGLGSHLNVYRDRRLIQRGMK
jgi:hypothetical protein